VANNEHLHSAGASLAYSPNGSSYTLLTDLRKAKPAPRQRELSKDTSLDSASATHLFTGGWKKTGVGTFSVYLFKTLWASIQTIFETAPGPGSVYFWQLTYPKLSTEASTGSNIVWQGVITELAPSEASIDSDDKIMVDVQIGGSGPITFTAGA
jgi:hypothetical protein